MRSRASRWEGALRLRRFAIGLTGMVVLASALGAGTANPLCADEGPQSAPVKKPPPELTTMTGMVRVVRGVSGGEPQMTDRHGKRWLLSGPLRKELLRLGGHKLQVWGRPAEKKLAMPTFRVQRYRLLGRAGEEPLVGRLIKGVVEELLLERPAGRLRVRASAPMRKALSRRVGCKIWVVGKLDGEVLKVRKFGWIACPRPKQVKPKKED